MTAPPSRVAADRSPAPSALRIALLVSGLSLRRLANRLAHLRSRARPSSRRRAVARKSSGGKPLLAFLAFVFVFQSAQLSVALVRRSAQLAELADHAGVALVRPSTLELVSWADRVRQSRHSSESDAYRDELDSAFSREAAHIQDEGARLSREQDLKASFESRGAAGFRASRVPEFSLLPSTELWYRGADAERMLKPLGLVALLLGLGVCLQHIAADRDLAKVDSGLEWLFSFPVPARALFLSRVFEAALAGPLVMAMVLPFYAVIFWCSGYGALGVGLGAAAALYVGALAGSLRVVIETSLRRFLSLAAVARVQSLLLVLSYLALVSSFAVAYSPRSEWLAALTERLPTGALYVPLSLPIWLCVGGGAAWVTAGLSLVGLLVLVSGSIVLAERMVREGVTSGSGALIAARRPARQKLSAAEASPGLLRGIVQKELRAVLRDRQLRAQALLTPLVLVGLQLWLNPQLVGGILSNPRHVATAAFALSILVMAAGACGALATEGPGLWLLYTVPRRLERVLLAKLMVWVALAAVFSLAVLGVVGFRSPALLVASLPYMALVLPGIAVYALIAFGLGTLGTDPLEPEPRRRIRAGAVNLFMILASLFAYALYVPSWWAKFVQLTLSGLLAFALWQKVRDHAPYWLDPSEAPPPRIAVADGVMAALAFFVLQGVIHRVLIWQGGSPAQVLPLAFVAAGLLVASTALWVFHRSGIPQLAVALGLRRPAGHGRVGGLDAVGLGLAAGLAAASVAVVYLEVIEQVEFLRRMRDEMVRSSSPEPGKRELWLFLTVVVAAPLFEEFIFRGVFYRGLRRSLSAPLAALASALVFALVHPALAALPVFVLALLSALAYERSRWLVTPVIAHVLYNAVVFLR